MNKLLKIALQQYGVTEIKGQMDNKRIVNYFQEIGHSWVKDDETAWCSAFVNWVALKAGYKGSGHLTARSWLQIGHPITSPSVGDIVIFWRVSKDSWKGHVGFYISHSQDGKYIYCLGGNQQNSVNISPYPTSRLLGYRTLQLDWEMK